MAEGSDKWMWSMEQPEWFVQGEQSRAYERTSRTKHEDKKTGSYERVSIKEKGTSGEQYVEKPTGRVGYKDEQVRTSTIKVGDKKGFTEYYSQQRVRRVNFGNSSGGSNSNSNKGSPSLKEY